MLNVDMLDSIQIGMAYAHACPSNAHELKIHDNVCSLVFCLWAEQAQAK